MSTFSSHDNRYTQVMLKKIDIVNCSFLEPFGGGRETWLGQWIPVMLDSDPLVRIRVFSLSSGLNSKIIFTNMKKEYLFRVDVLSFECKKTSIPLNVKFFCRFFFYYRFKNNIKPNLIIGVGGFWESINIS